MMVSQKERHLVGRLDDLMANGTVN
jgi:hypothetical protein